MVGILIFTEFTPLSTVHKSSAGREAPGNLDSQNPKNDLEKRVILENS